MRALAWLKNNFAPPMRIEQIAREVHMSVSEFYHQFRAVTAMSPLQYQKQLRLQEARRLMLGAETDAATTARRRRKRLAVQPRISSRLRRIAVPRHRGPAQRNRLS